MRGGREAEQKGGKSAPAMIALYLGLVVRPKIILVVRQIEIGATTESFTGGPPSQEWEVIVPYFNHDHDYNSSQTTTSIPLARHTV
jgi:hypothetical protein